ncbi:MAG: dihydrolipoyl dehydrogenase [Candidatus Sumerlaeota bacterium]|nr:dihydrolipoyl dehydrogenase [Candidatus Sumerlaeota bacterium]
MSTDTKETQLAVLGAGPGGYAAAFHAAEKGMRVALVDRDPKPGGVCLHRGCIPSKALLHVAKLINEAGDAKAWGVKFAKPKIDLDALREWKTGVVDRLANGVVELGRRRGVEYIQARAAFVDSRTLQLFRADDGPEPPARFLQYENAILCTGSQPAWPGALKLDDERVMDSTSALQLEDVPGKLLVIGGGYIGLELGTVYAALGSEVTVVELTGGLLPGVDRDLIRPVQTRLAQSFKAIHLNTRVERMESRENGIVVRLRGEGAPEEATFDRALVSVGRWPNSQGIGLDATRVEVDSRGFVAIDRQRRTRDPRIFAIGDVAGEPMLAHKASREGKVAVEVIGGANAEFDNVAIPAVVFTDPEIAWCGLTETQAQAEKRTIRVARFPWAASGRAITLGRPEGMTKLVIDPETQRVLGMGVVGTGAGELIAEGVLAVEMAAVAADVADSIHPHPTLTETVQEAAESFFGLATHLYRPKK